MKAKISQIGNSVGVILPKEAVARLKIKKGDITKGTVNISFPVNEIKLSKQNISIGVYDDKGELLDTFKTYFEGPFKLQF